MSAGQGTSWRLWLAIVAAIGGTIVFACVMVGTLTNRSQRPMRIAVADADAALAEPGIRATFSAGGVTVTRTLSELSLALGPGEPPDPELPPGTFAAIVAVTFMPAQAPTAAIGAEIQGGSLIISLDGEPQASDYAGPELRRVMSRQIPLRMRPYTANYTFRSESGVPVRLRALWQPDGSPVQPLIPRATARPSTPSLMDIASP
jgi:hypothetical protein